MFTQPEKLKAFVCLWSFATGGRPATIREVYCAWDAWHRAHIGLAKVSYSWLSTKVRQAREAGLLEVAGTRPKRYRSVDNFNWWLK